MSLNHIITIDGGAASGKSSTSRALADRLNLLHVDTGSYYRSITHALLQTGCDPENLESVKEALQKIELGYEVVGRMSQILLNGEKLGDSQIRSEEVNAAVSKFASIPIVRAKLLQYQRDHACIFEKEGFDGLVMEGRDIGSVVFPKAKMRFFLEADEVTRQARRAKEGQIDSIKERDQMDSNRKSAPLKVPEGAERVDTSNMTLDEVVEHIANRVSQEI